jgi:hypothetical protein
MRNFGGGESTGVGSGYSAPKDGKCLGVEEPEDGAEGGTDDDADNDGGVVE